MKFTLAGYLQTLLGDSRYKPSAYLDYLMNRNDVMSVVAESICDETQYPMPDNIIDTTTASDVPGWDSLAHVRIMLGIEMELDITVPLEDTYKVVNIGELVDLVQNLTA